MPALTLTQRSPPLPHPSHSLWAIPVSEPIVGLIKRDSYYSRFCKLSFSLYIDLARWWSSKPLTNDTRLLFFCSYFLGMAASVIGLTMLPTFLYIGASPPWFSGFLSFLVTHWILILVPLSLLSHNHNLACYTPGTIVSLIATGFLIKVYPIWSVSLA